MRPSEADVVEKSRYQFDGRFLEHPGVGIALGFAPLENADDAAAAVGGEIEHGDALGRADGGERRQDRDADAP